MFLTASLFFPMRVVSFPSLHVPAPATTVNAIQLPEALHALTSFAVAEIALWIQDMSVEERADRSASLLDRLAALDDHRRESCIHERQCSKQT